MARNKTKAQLAQVETAIDELWRKYSSAGWPDVFVVRRAARELVAKLTVRDLWAMSHRRSTELRSMCERKISGDA